MRHTAAWTCVRRSRRLTTGLVVLSTILTVGCELTTEGGVNPNAPSALGTLLSGSWRYQAGAGGSGFPSASDCTELELNMVQESETTSTGTFRATCNGGIELEGTATGVLVDDVLTIDASGTATLSGGTACAFTLTGTAQMEGDAIRVDYSGNTCLGAISGSELLQRS